MSHPTTIKYDVFLSFRGEDTRENFTSHLYKELRRKNIETFIDYKLGRGEEISPALLKAIDESVIYVVILSEHYASSTWCLEELRNIVECKEKYGREIIPVFYKVEPSNVRHQRETYAEDFANHGKQPAEKVEAWKDALRKVAGLSGMDSKNFSHDSELVEEIAKDVLNKLKDCSSSDHQRMIGIEKHIEQIQSLMLLESPPVRIIGIWGMGGIGKSTIVNAIYRKLITDFSSGCIVLNFKQEVERVGLEQVKRKCLSQLLDDKDMTSSGSSFSHNRRLERAKVLFVLDDVSDSGQIIGIIRHSNFGKWSRIIVTSRDKQVLNNVVDYIYHVKEMDFQDSLQLFSLSAFKQNFPKETYEGLSEEVLRYAKGIPLVLKIFGLSLHDKVKEIWESALKKLEKKTDLTAFNVLKLSYDGLDDEQKDIFLDIACFYRGHLENVVEQTLDCCDFSARYGMDVLKDRCLISNLEGRIVMHDLVQEMGQKIVQQQCVDNPGKRSRLWMPNDIYTILRNNRGTDAIHCIFLDLRKIKKVEAHAEAFKEMHNLRMIQFYNPAAFHVESNVILRTVLKSLPDNLKFLRWDGFPQRSLPLDFCPENLVTLDMPHSHLEKLWDGDQDLPKLKRLNLSYSQKLIAVPDFYLCPNIEEIILSHCASLVQVHSSGFLDNLNCLYVNGCVELRSLNLPSNILSKSSGLVVLHGCVNLETLVISSSRTEVVQSNNCSRFYELWDFEAINVNGLGDKPEKKKDARGYEIGEYSSRAFRPIDNAKAYENEEPLDNICLLNMKVKIDTMPSLFSSINQLCWLDISKCESLTFLPPEIFNLNFLRRLYLGGCLNLEELPEIKKSMENLTVLILDKTAIKELPSSLNHLIRLEELSLQRCSRLMAIPSSIGNLSKLVKLDLTDCESLETFPSSIFKLKLTKLDMHGCTMLRTFPEILEPTESFTLVNLTKTAIQNLPSSLEYLVGLQTLCLNLCTNLVSLPNSIVKLNLLSVLDCSGCCSLTKIPDDIGCLTALTKLSLQESAIINLPGNMAHLSNLKSLDISDCKWLDCIPKLPLRLDQFSAFDCQSIKTLMPNSEQKLLSTSKEGTFKFHFTNSQKLDETFSKNIGDESWHKISDDAYRIVFFSFPGSEVPSWLPYSCKGNSVTMRKEYPYSWGYNRLVGFALCVVFQRMDIEDTESTSFKYRLTFESNGRKVVLPYHYLQIGYYWKGRSRYFIGDHTFVWKYQLDVASIGNELFHAYNFTLDIQEDSYHLSNSPSNITVKECGICPLYTKDNGIGSNVQRFLYNGNEGSSGSNSKKFKLRN